MRRPVAANVFRTGIAVAVSFAILAGGAGYWMVFDAQKLSTAPDNPGVIAVTRRALRGAIEDRQGRWLAVTRRDENDETYRVYRHPSVAHVTGYLSRQFGATGLEARYDAELRGVQRADPVEDLLKKFDLTPADPLNLNVSLDLELQQLATRALGSDFGAVVMLDPTTGEIYALASRPVFDASLISGPDPEAAAAAFEELRQSSNDPLLPRATLGRYVPGSTFKIVTAVAGLSSNRITAQTTFAEQPKAERDGLVVSGFRIREHPGVPSETFRLREATEWSSNIWYALAGLRIGGEELTDAAGRMGFGAALPFELPTAVSQVTNGDGRDPGGFSDDVELASASFGQAETFVTPLQMALVAATVANDGVLMKPHLALSLQGKEGGTRTFSPEQVRRVLSAGDAGAIQSAMQAAVESEIGRQFTSGAKVEGIPTAGKSGTAELGGTGEPHSWFIGFAPVRDPKIAIAVLVERGGRGGERAAPIAGDLMTAYFDRYGRP
jgi:peptidoglycan glycosyltransferase